MEAITGPRGLFKTMQVFGKVLSFAKEVHLEVKKVNWLRRREVLHYTITVIAFSLIVSIYLGALDFLFRWLLARFVS